MVLAQEGQIQGETPLMPSLLKPLLTLAAVGLAAAPAPSVAVILFNDTTDTIEGTSSLTFGGGANQATYEARILFTSTYNGGGLVFNQWTSSVQDAQDRK